MWIQFDWIDQEEETKEIIENGGGGGDNNNLNTVSARPRRMSEVQDPPQPILPIPEGSSYFILSQNNRCDKIQPINRLKKINRKSKYHKFISQIHQQK